MDRLETEEKELELGVSSTIEEMNGSYGVSGLNESALQEKRLGDIELRKQLVELIRMIVRLRKICECYADQGLLHAGYDVNVHIYSKSMEYKIKHRTDDSKK